MRDGTDGSGGSGGSGGDVNDVNDARDEAGPPGEGSDPGSGSAPGNEGGPGGEPGPGRGSGSRLLPPRPEGKPLHPVTPWRRAWAPVAGIAAFSVQDPGRIRDWAEQLSLGWFLLAVAVLLPLAAAYGFLSWWYTAYLVTDTELRIRTGLLFRRAAHIRLDRIQAVDVGRPLLARVVGVAKLKIDAVGTEAKDELAFLGERDAVDLRAELLARSAGIAPEAAPAAGEAPSREMLRVDPRTLAVGLLLTGSGWGALAAVLVVPTLIHLATHSIVATLAVLLPLLGGLWKSSLGRFLREYDWTVAESPDGLRIDHGLLDREHATVPPGRVQAVRLVEPLLWRRRGWVRVELDVAGGDRKKAEAGVLVPVASWADASGVLARVLPGTDVGEARKVLTGVPERSRWCFPVYRRGYRHGATASVFVTRSGLLGRRTTLVPHAKVQSVRCAQGPWQRRMRLADVSVDHGANGHTTARLRDADEAYAIVRAQAERSRTGRRTARPDRWLT